MVNLSKVSRLRLPSAVHKECDDIVGSFKQVNPFETVHSMIGLLKYTYSNLFSSSLRKSWSHVKQLLWGINRITANNCIVFGVYIFGMNSEGLRDLDFIDNVEEPGWDWPRYNTREVFEEVNCSNFDGLEVQLLLHDVVSV